MTETILATPGQREREALAIKLLASQPMQDALARVRKLYADHDLGKTAAGQASIERASSHFATTAALFATIEDSDNPYLLWSTCAEHQWMGLDVPGSGYGLDNPDNIYRMAQVDGGVRYEIKGQIVGKAPQQHTLVLFRSIPGITQAMNEKGTMAELSGTNSDSLEIAADGSFTITIDSTPANGRPNHITTPADMKGLHLLGRDSMSDWSVERPVRLDIRRLDPPSGPGLPDEAALAKRAAEMLDMITPYWLAWVVSHVYARPVNEVPQPWLRVTGWGCTQQGNFKLGADEAWVITLDAIGARYFNFQLCDPWAVARNYVTKQSSLTGHQADRNADGTYTFVVSAQDPSVHNWLDTDGIDAGTYQCRWQGLPKGTASSDGTVVSTKIVKLADLKSALPAETRFLTHHERKAQLAQRAKDYANRVA